MSAKILTLDELKEKLERANDEMETADAALQSAQGDSGTDEGIVDELRSKFDETVASVTTIAEAIERKEKMAAAIAAVPRETGERKSSEPTVRILNEPLTYRRASEGGQYSFFRDVYAASVGDFEAQTRLQRHTREMAALGVEQRAITTSSGGPGLVPTVYFQELIAKFARAGRPFADAIGGRPLPPDGVSFQIPRVTTGSTTAVTSEGSGVNDSSPVTDDITLALNTVTGKVDMSRQLAERSTPAADELIGQDLAADYAKQLDTQLLTQATNGILNLSGTNSSTTSTATVVSLYAKLADATQLIWTNAFVAPNLIVMHPRRWAAVLAAVDSSNRPLVVPSVDDAIQIFNAFGATGNKVPQGLVGTMQGLPVVIDPNVPTNLGAGTNEDRVIVTDRTQQVLFEVGTPSVQVMTEVLSGNLQVRLLCYGYFAFSFARLPKSSTIISGTGLVTPTF